MARAYFIPGEGYINETTSTAFFVPGWGYINATSGTGNRTFSYTTIMTIFPYILVTLAQFEAMVPK